MNRSPIASLSLCFLLCLAGCNQASGPGNQEDSCSGDDCSSERSICEGADCAPGPAQGTTREVSGAPIERQAPADEEVIDPEQEREADELGKLGVERDILEGQLEQAELDASEADEELADASGPAEAQAATARRDRARQEIQRLRKSLDTLGS